MVKDGQDWSSQYVAMPCFKPGELSTGDEMIVKMTV